MGDTDLDGDVDGADYAIFAGCMGGPAAEPVPPSPCLEAFDFDGDQDVDLEDYAEFSIVFTAP